MTRAMSFFPDGQRGADRRFGLGPCPLTTVDFCKCKMPARTVIITITSEGPFERGKTLSGQAERVFYSVLMGIALRQADRCNREAWIPCWQFFKGDHAGLFK